MENFATKMQDLASEKRERINAVLQKTVDSYVEFQQKVQDNSEDHVKFVLQEIEKVANEGYGSCYIKLDCTTDMFDMLENVNSYSATTVRFLLQKEGLHLSSQIHDYYDAYECKITWGKKLPTSDYRIPMSES